MKGERYKELEENIKSIVEDYRIETLLCELAENKSFDLNKVYLRPNSLFKRTFSKDVQGFKLERREEDNQVGGLTIYLNREGLYDAIPEAMTHKPIPKDSLETTEKTIKEVKTHDVEEEQARTFFAPIENEMYKLRILLEKEERTLQIGFTKSYDNFREFWQLPYNLDVKKLIKLLYVIPIAHNVVGNLVLTSAIAKVVLSEEVKITYIIPQKKQYGKLEEPILGLGQTTLGYDSIVSGDFYDGTKDVKITVGPIVKEELISYLDSLRAGKKPNPKLKYWGYNLNLIKTLLKFFLPFQSNFVMDILIDRTDSLFVLDKNKDAEARLGYTTVLND